MSMMAPDPLGLAAIALSAGVKTLNVTMGKRGVVYFALRDSTGCDLERAISEFRWPDPHGVTGCGATRQALPVIRRERRRVGATYFSSSGGVISRSDARRSRGRGKKRRHRGASGLARYLRGELSIK